MDLLAGETHLHLGLSGRIPALMTKLKVLRRFLGTIVIAAVPMMAAVSGQAPTGAYDGEGFIILRHPETEVVERGLEFLVSTVRVELG